MAKFNEYTQKATPADNDTMMIYDAAAKANKLSPFSGIWNWMVNKLTNAVINNLQTSNKTVVGALNELNSNRVAVYIGKITTSKTGEIATNNFISGSSIKNIIAVKIFDSAGSRNVHTELYSYKTYAFVVAKNDVGDRLVNTELDIVAFYIK
jgi:hypothetical protein